MDKTEEYLKIISSGTIEEIADFALKYFHNIKHITSFTAMIDRLKDMQCLLTKIDKKLDDANSVVYGIKNLIRGE